MALPLVHAARHNDVKPLLGRELMILTHDDDDDDVCMCYKPDEVDRDVRHGQVTQDHDDDDDVCMYILSLIHI